MNFWDRLPKPIIALAPMADVTDPAFRRIIAKYGKPDVLWTEFVSADGLFLGGYDALIKDLDFTPAERPIVAQFFTSNADMMRKAASLAKDLGFDGIDINMGCPDKRIERRGAGATLMKYPERAQPIIRAAKQGAGNVPLSVKTRLGWNRGGMKDAAYRPTSPWHRELLANTKEVWVLNAVEICDRLHACVPVTSELAERIARLNDVILWLRRLVPQQPQYLLIGHTVPPHAH